MRAKVKELNVSLNHDPAFFKSVYQFTFSYNLTDGARVLPIDTAVEIWTLLLKDKFALFDKWITFTTDVYGKSVTRDTWNMILEFSIYAASDPNLEQYDEEGAWPSVIDEFVEYVKDL
ncbi:hypothetical protein DV451_002869 [Geotrichum candidum]|nr:hypothetical protein DV451_002869 [Geotrichum candidum]KAI9211960.1 hypothetical protein DS838_003174 [Geotrichum bryndzae]KAF5105730.1 hypothetical protein DV453_004563 [Geotrichum candidum]KAF5109867.1 hypothetical protein DV452_004603 [Geotrichum candidum]KAF5112337.1 hypothetical protein DV454_004281 [Geotrichum candidum]